MCRWLPAYGIRSWLAPLDGLYSDAERADILDAPPDGRPAATQGAN
jgi:hypothetical protein